ncbi:MAG: (deoxy)nucleoside triphosphate pyrophosphohydrolase [Coriobacteriia bacterium]|nr:(deoxy)nucleoside triphosphate pyrophosphohydrolase [Coriobacteriia bacterium]
MNPADGQTPPSSEPFTKAAAAIVVHRRRVLAARRSAGKRYDGWWEFPGGKLEKGEEFDQCCVREIAEELNLAVSIERHFYTVNYTYPEFCLHMECFLCHPQSADFDIRLSAHDDYRWLDRANLYSVKWLPAAFTVLRQLEEEPFWKDD